MPKDNTDVSVQIDENNLDKECVRLPNDYLVAATRAAEAKRTVAELEAEKDVVEADLSKSIRSNPASYGLEKVTEAALSSTVLVQEEYTDVVDRLQKARYSSDLAQALVWAMEHKKRSLTLLVELHGLGYFSDPKVSRAGREAVEDMTRRRVRRHNDD